jgi:hypothetical protein
MQNMHQKRNQYANKYAEYEHPLLCTQNTQENTLNTQKNTLNTQKNMQIIRRIRKNTQHPFGIRRIVTCSYSAYSAYVRTPHFADEWSAAALAGPGPEPDVRLGVGGPAWSASPDTDTLAFRPSTTVMATHSPARRTH